MPDTRLSMQRHLDILKRYWGYDSFRPLQADIIRSVSEGRDTLGLMPTGGGKSLTFQVPALAKEGVCIVVTPLIALMKDQVKHLKERDIAAAALHAGMTREEISLTVDNCVYGAYKFLYVSPERLSTSLFLEKVRQMEVCLLAVDESHCISQWGYDFRPSYLRIAEVRTLLPGVPVLALTATATPQVVDDIQEKLLFSERNVLRMSFKRDNLSYVVRPTGDKMEQLLTILRHVPGSSVVYVRNRKRTKEIAELLLNNGVSAESFHAGMNDAVKDAVQRRWTEGITRVIVATNAFGMGIDKPDVRTVVHIDLPDSLEAYFQEAGRAGRDGEQAYAVLLTDKSDTTKMKNRIANSFPPKETVRRVYESLGNYLQVGVGSGLDVSFPFDFEEFCSRFHLQHLQAYSALRLLQQAGYVEFTDEQEHAARVMFVVAKDRLYHYRQNEWQERLVHALLRSYTGLFADPVPISENMLANHLNCRRDEVCQALVQLARDGIIRYIPRRKTPFLTWTREREDVRLVALPREVYEKRRERYETRIGHMLHYAQDRVTCRSRMLLAYFGERDAKPCGRCDVCRKNAKHAGTKLTFDTLHATLLSALPNHPMTLDEMAEVCACHKEVLYPVVRFMLDNGELHSAEGMRFSLEETTA